MTPEVFAKRQAKRGLRWRAAKIRLRIEVDRAMGVVETPVLDELEQRLAEIEKEIDELPE